LGQVNPIVHQDHDRPETQGERPIGVAQRFSRLEPTLRAMPNHNQYIPIHGILHLCPDAEQTIGPIQ
jgi:hypothetical protein